MKTEYDLEILGGDYNLIRELRLKSHGASVALTDTGDSRDG